MNTGEAQGFRKSSTGGRGQAEQASWPREDKGWCGVFPTAAMAASPSKEDSTGGKGKVGVQFHRQGR